MRYKRKAKSCNVCGAQTDVFMCVNCAADLRNLLLGARGHGEQPGIVWYIHRLTEQAYKQSRLGAVDSSHGARDGYELLVDDRATRLLAKIRATLADWNSHCDGLSATLSHEIGLVLLSGHRAAMEPLEVRQAIWLAAHMKAIRRIKDSHRLYGALLLYAKDGWLILNRPADVCCGPCPRIFKVGKPDEELCGAMIYALESAKSVRCPYCRTKYSVNELREALRDKVKDLLFTGPELRRLMETRLNDRMPKATFYKLIADGRLQPRKVLQNKDSRGVIKDVPMFTYDDVCEAREKPSPTRKINVKS